MYVTLSSLKKEWERNDKDRQISPATTKISEIVAEHCLLPVFYSATNFEGSHPCLRTESGYGCLWPQTRLTFSDHILTSQMGLLWCFRSQTKTHRLCSAHSLPDHPLAPSLASSPPQVHSAKSCSATRINNTPVACSFCLTFVGTETENDYLFTYLCIQLRIAGSFSVPCCCFTPWERKWEENWNLFCTSGSYVAQGP